MCTHKGVHCSIDHLNVVSAVLPLCVKVYLFQEPYTTAGQGGGWFGCVHHHCAG